MDLFVIVLCLLSERFLMHKSVHQRFHWFMSYSGQISSKLPAVSPRILLLLVLLPFLLGLWIVLNSVDHLFFDLVGILLNVVIFYYCLGPINPFYPIYMKPVEDMLEEDIGVYLVEANNQLFAILFWYLVLGAVGILAYRMVSLAKNMERVSVPAYKLLQWLDWIPVRMTALLYLLVGNFQEGFRCYSKLFFSHPDKNNTLLSACGLAALDNREPKTIVHAENLVEHATVVFLVLLAFCTIVAWV